MVRKRGILIVCLTISFILIVLTLINFNFSDISPTGKTIFEKTEELSNTDNFFVNNIENISSSLDDFSLIKNRKSNSKKTITGYVSKEDETEKKVLKEYKPKQINQEEIFLDKKFKDNGRYIISSLNEYFPEWYPSNSPKADLKKLTIELQVTDKVTGKNFSIKGTGDIPKYYGGHFDFNTSLDDLVLFKDINPNFVWEYSEEYSILPVEKYKTAIIEGGKIMNRTFVDEKVFKNYKPLDNQIKQNIPKELFLDPDVSACGSLGSAGATYDVTTSLTSSGTCIQITADNVTLDCHGYLITYSTSGTQNDHGIDIGISGTAQNATIKNCRIQDGYWTTSTSTNLYRVGIYSQYANYSKFINNTLNVSNGITFYFLREKYLNLTENTAYGEYIGTTFDYVYNSTVLNHRATTYPSGSWGFRHERSVNNTLVNLNTTALNSNHGLWFQNSTNTNFINLRTFSTSGYGIYIDISNNSVFKDCISINGGGSYDVAYNSLSGSANNTFLNCSYTLSKEYVTGTGNQLIRQWYYQAYVNDSVGSVVENANVTGRNSSSIVQFTAQTNSSGWIARQNVTEYINRAGTRTYGNNYSINGSKSGYTADVNSWNFTLQQNLINDVLTLTGGGVSCGATMTTPNTLYTLSGNITSTDTCFNVGAANVTIDCQGYWITYSTNGGNGEYGIYTNQYNTTVKNCNILDGYTSSNDNWRVGLNLISSNYSTLFNNTIRVHNSTAVYLEAVKSLNVTLNIARSAEDNGFSFYYIWNSTFENNTGWSADEGGDGEGIVFEYANNNTVFRNNGTSMYRGIALTWSSNNNITNNWAQGGNHADNAGLLLGYSSTNNTLINNTGISSGAGIFFWEYTDNNTLINNTGICTSEESAGLTFYTSSGNKVSGQRAMGWGTNADAIAIIDSSNTIIRDCVNLTSVANDFAVYGSNPANNNTVINCSYSTSKEYVQGSNIYQLIRKWYYQASANYTNGTLASGVNITAYNTTGIIQFTELTNSSGLISRKEIIEYNNSAGTRTFYNNYILNASLSGYSTITRPNYNLTVKQNNVTDFFTFTGTSGGDTTPPTITFESPTPSNTSSTSNPVTLVANISDASNTSSWIDLDRSLIGYWAMDYYNYTHIFDNSSYKRNGSFSGGVNYTNLSLGARGQALRFNGTNQQLIVPDSPIYDFITAGTVSIWVNQLTSIGDYDMPFFKGGSSAGVVGYDFELGGGDWYTGISNGTASVGTNICYYSATPLTGWHMLTFTFDTTTNKLTCYIDGTNTSSGVDITGFGSIVSPYNLYLGGDELANNDFNGSIDEILIFNRSLSSTEIKALYSSQINKFNTSSMNLSNGQHNYTVYAIDEAGNTASSGWRYFIVSGGGSGISSCQNLNTANTIYTLTSNVSSTGTCFTIGASNITLDCNGYWINYYNTTGSTNYYGVSNLYTPYNNITIKNCKFRNGNRTIGYFDSKAILLYESLNSTIFNNTFDTANSPGIYLQDGTNFTNVTNNYAFCNNSQAMRLDYASNRNYFLNNTAISGWNEGTVCSHNSSFNTFVNHTSITASPNDWHGGVYLWQGSVGNIFINLNASATGTADAIYISNSSSNTFIDCKSISGANYDVYYYTDAGSTLNTFINCSYSTSKEYVTSGNSLIRKWYYMAYVNDSGGNPIYDVNITARNSSSVIQFTEQTNSSGSISRQNVTEYVNTGGTRLFWNNYTINASKATLAGVNHSFNFTTQQNKVNDWFTLNVSDSTPPTITFEEPPTPSNGSTAASPVTIVANISDASNTSAWMDIDRSLVGYWAMDYYNYTHIFDNSSYKKNGSFSGGVNYTNLTTGKRGNALTLNGINQQIIISDSDIYDFPVSGTVSIWVNSLSSTSDYDMPFWRGGSSVVVPGYDFELGLGDWYSELTNGTAASVCYYSATPLVGWNMLTFTFDTVTNRLTCYVNGTLIESIDITDFGGIDSSSPIYLGTADSNNWDFNGSIDEVLIFNRSLSSTEVKALYSSQINKFNTSSISLSNGQHNYTVYAIDEYGNANNSGLRNFEISSGPADSTPPTITFESPTPSNTSSTTSPVNIVANISDESNTSSFMDFDRTLRGYWSMDYYNTTGIRDNSTYNMFGGFNGGLSTSDIGTGKRGNALTFDSSTSDYLSIGTYTLSELTFSMWVKRNTYSGWVSLIGANGVSGYEFDLDSSGNGTVNAYTASNLRSVTSLAVGQWYHVALVTNATGSFMFINGVKESQNSYTTGITATSLALGRWQTSQYFNGSLDEVMIFNRSLSASEIKALYSSQINKFNTSNMTLSTGTHTYNVYAIDEYGNAATSGLRNFLVQASSTLSACKTSGWSANTIYTLTQNVSSSDYCFILDAENVTIDCNGYKITYGTTAGDYYAFYNDGYNGATLKNCLIIDGNYAAGLTYWRPAIVIDANYSTIFKNKVSSYMLPFYMEYGFYGNITNNTFLQNGSSYSLDVYYSHNNTFLGNNATGVTGDGRGFEIEGSNYNTFINNSGAGCNKGWVLSESDYNTFIGNIFMVNINCSTEYSPDGILLWIGADYNTFTNDSAIIKGVDINGYAGAGINFYQSSYNTVSGFNVTSILNDGDGINVYDSDNILVRDCRSLNINDIAVGADTSVTNFTVINCSYSLADEYIQSGAELIRKWYYRAYANYTNSTPASGVNINISSLNGGSGGSYTWSNELLKNPLFEWNNLTHWTPNSASYWSTCSSSYNISGGINGSSYHACTSNGASSTSYLYQDVNISAWASQIDAGTAVVTAYSYAIAAEIPPTQDHGRAQVMYLNESMAVMAGGLDTGDKMTQPWFGTGFTSSTPPSKARYVRIWGNTYEVGYGSGAYGGGTVKVGTPNNLTTDATGWIDRQEVTEYINSAGTRTYYNNYSVNASLNVSSIKHIFNFTITQNKVEDYFTFNGSSGGCGTISTPNIVYNLTSNATTTGSCLIVAAQNVTINCSGYSIIGANNTDSIGIYSNYPYTKIENCTILNFSTGIYLNYSANNSWIKNVTINQTYTSTCTFGLGTCNAVALMSPHNITIYDLDASAAWDEETLYMRYSQNVTAYNSIIDVITMSFIRNLNLTNISTGSLYLDIDNVCNISNIRTSRFGTFSWLGSDISYNCTVKDSVFDNVDIDGGDKLHFSNLTVNGSMDFDGSPENSSLINSRISNGIWMYRGRNFRIFNVTVLSNTNPAFRSMTTYANISIINSSFNSNNSNVIYLEDGSKGIIFMNNTFISGTGSGNLIRINAAAGNNTFYWNNFTQTSGYYINNTNNTNQFNTTVGGVAQGNYYYNITSKEVYDTNSDGWGDYGLEYPLNATNWNTKWTGFGQDYGPATTRGLGCGIISTPGIYTLTNNVSSQGTCFTISAANVTIDCNGYWIIFSTGGAVGTRGIYSNQFNTTIKNCNILDGNWTTPNSWRAGVFFTVGADYGLIQNVSTNVSNCHGIDMNGGNSTMIVNSTGRTGSYYGIIIWTDASNITLINSIGISNTSNGIGIFGNNNSIYNSTGQSTYDGYGFYLDSASNNIISGSNASSYLDHGIFLQNSTNNTLIKNNITSNSANGLVINLYSSNNTFIDNNATANAGTGIYILGYSNNNILLRNIARSQSTFNHGIYIYNSSYTNLTENTGISISGHGIILDEVSDNSTLTSNNGTSYAADMYGIHFGTSSNNILINSTGINNNNGIGIYLGSSSNNNTLINNTGISNTGQGVYLYSNYNNTFINQRAYGNLGIFMVNVNWTTFRDCGEISGTTFDVNLFSTPLSKNVTFINCSYDTETVGGTENQLIRKWYYQAYVNYSNGTLAYDANVTAYNITGQIQFTEQTNASGWIQRKEVIDYINTGGTRLFWNNYTINASKAGYGTDNHIWNFTIQTNKIDDFLTLNLFVSSCIYTSGNWNINCSESCTINTNYDVGNNNITINGTGTIIVSANITNYNKLHIEGVSPSNICTVRCVSGGCFND